MNQHTYFYWGGRNLASVSTSVTSIVAVECKKKNDNSNLTDKFIYFTVHPPDKGIIFNKKKFVMN